MSDEKKVGPVLKSFKAKTHVKTDDGYSETWDISDNQPNAKKPATPIEALTTTVGSLARYAVMYANQGGDVAIEALKRIEMAWSWKSSNGYVVEDNPRMKVLNYLAEQMGFDLVPKKETVKEPS